MTNVDVWTIDIAVDVAVGALPPVTADAAPSRWVGVDLTGDWPILSAEERRRAAGFRFSEDARRYCRRRAAVRKVLAEHVGGRPEHLRFTKGQYGRPELLEHPFSFSVTHSGALTMIAVSGRGRVGVDAERVRALDDREAMMSMICTQSEIERVARCEHSERDREFLRIWTLKEAVLKGVGVGLMIDPRRLSTDAVNDQWRASGIGAASATWQITAGDHPWYRDTVVAAAISGVDRVTLRWQRLPPDR